MDMPGRLAIDDRAAVSIGAWARAIGSAALLAIGLFASIDAVDSLSSSSPGFAAKQWGRHMVGSYQGAELQAQALFAYAALQSGLPAIGWTRVSTGDRLGEIGADGMFNPVVFKVTFGEGFSTAAPHQQRWLAFHESGHVAAMLTSRFEPASLPSWKLSKGAQAAMGSSILYRQAYAESFADVFAVAMSLRMDWNDPSARQAIGSAMDRRIDSVSIAHDTQPALAIAARWLPELASMRAGKLLGLVDEIASQGALRTVADWGAEREALCLVGWSGWSRWARDGAHEFASNPWRMAPALAPAQGEPLSSELSELMALSPGRGYMRSRSELAYASYARRSAELGNRAQGAEPAWLRQPAAKALESAPSLSRERAWAGALADYEPASKSVVRSMLSGPFLALSWISGEQAPWGCPED